MYPSWDRQRKQTPQDSATGESPPPSHRGTRSSCRAARPALCAQTAGRWPETLHCRPRYMAGSVRSKEVRYEKIRSLKMTIHSTQPAAADGAMKTESRRDRMLKCCAAHRSRSFHNCGSVRPAAETESLATRKIATRRSTPHRDNDSAYSCRAG